MDATVAGADASTTLGVIRGLITALTMVVYAGIFYWAYRRGNRERFDQDALIPFMDELSSPALADTEETSR